MVDTDKNNQGTLVIIDESHNLVEHDEESSAWSLAFSGGDERRTILATATPPKSMKEDVLGSGKISAEFSYTMREAIANGEIADYNMVLPLVRDMQFKPVELSELDSRENVWDAMGRAIFHAGAMHHDGCRRSIVYCRSVAECEAYQTAFKSVCKDFLGVPCWTSSITCEDSSKKRRIILEDFERPSKEVELRIVTSIRILDEALDIPTCDSVFFTNVSADSSERNWSRTIQRMSRATRKDPLNPHKVANVYIWTSADEDSQLAEMLTSLRQTDPQFIDRVRVVSSQYDRAVADKEVQELCHKALAEWQREFQVISLGVRQLTDLKVSWLCEHFSKHPPMPHACITVSTPEEANYNFRAGWFLYDIRKNFIDGHSGYGTCLTRTQKNRVVESCEWAATAHLTMA